MREREKERWRDRGRERERDQESAQVKLLGTHMIKSERATVLIVVCFRNKHGKVKSPFPSCHSEDSQGQTVNTHGRSDQTASG